MALTKEDLQAIQRLLEPIHTRLDTVDSRLDTMQADMNTRFDAIEGRLTALSADMAHHNHVVEPQLKLIHEGLGGWNERAKQVDRHESKLEDHGDRIFALEYVVKAK